MFFQDLFGLITFDDRFEQLAAARPQHRPLAPAVLPRPVSAPPHARVRAKSARRHHRRHREPAAQGVAGAGDLGFPVSRRRSARSRELALLNAVHDVFLLMADVRFAYELPTVSDGWIEAYDVETGRTRVLSRRELRRLAARVTRVAGRHRALARDAGLDVVRVGLDRWEMETALVEFTAERRLRKM